MSGLIHPLWDSPPKDVPELQRQAHRLMMRLLMRIRSRVPEILSAPETCDGNRVMDAAMASSLNPKIDRKLRVAALTLLERRIRTVDPRTPRRLFLPKPAQRSALSPTFGADLADLDQFEEALETYLLAERPGRELRHAAPANAEKALRALGLLMALLVTRHGQISLALLGRVVQALSRPAWIGGKWAWVDIEIPESTQGPVQTRRLFMDPTTLAAWLMAADGVATLGPAKEGTKAGKVNVFFRNLAKQGFAALLKQLRSQGHSTAINSLDRLCECQNQRLHVAAMPLIATYARGEIASSSLELSTWLRLIGFRAADDGSDSDRQEASQALAGQEPGGESDVSEQLLAGDLEETGLLADLRRLMHAPRTEWGRLFDTQLTTMRLSMATDASAVLAVAWLRHLAVERKNKGKRLADGSLHYYRGLLVNRLITTLPPSLASVNAEELLEAYEELISSRRSPQQTSRIRSALADFDRYVRTHHIPALPRVTLSGFEGGSYAISARIISTSEFLLGLRLIDDGSLVFESPVLASQLRVFWILAFRFGLRRAEILGVQARDMDDQWLRVRVNSARSLKTANAYRLIPINALPEAELVAVRSLAVDRHDEDCLFFKETIPTRKEFDAHPVISRVNDLLNRVAGDQRLHPHNLRHAASTLLPLGFLGPDLGLVDHPYAEAWMHEAIPFARNVDQAISGRLHRRAGRGAALGMLLGHGDETTTYEHYVHSLDLLLFFSCCSGRFDPVKAAPEGHGYPKRNETALLLAMLGYHPTSRVNTRNPTTLLKGLAQRRPVGVMFLASSTGSGTLQAVAQPLTRRISLGDLLAIEALKTWRGRPDTQAQYDTVNELLDLIDAACRENADRLHAAFALWLRYQLKNDDWASMPGDQASAFCATIQGLAPGLQLESCWVQSVGRKTVKTGLKNTIQLRTACGRGTGKIWVRIKDPRPKPTMSRKKKSVRVLSMNQSTVSWVVRGIAGLTG